MALWRTCAYCGKWFGRRRAACPRCKYPVDGDLAAPSAARAAGRATKETCTHCGKTFPAGRPACPHCGADHETGWKSWEDQDHDGTDLPDTFTDDDYRDVVRDVHPARAEFWTTRKARYLVVGVVLVLAMVVPALVALWRMRISR